MIHNYKIFKTEKNSLREFYIEYDTSSNNYSIKNKLNFLLNNYLKKYHILKKNTEKLKTKSLHILISLNKPINNFILKTFNKII